MGIYLASRSSPQLWNRAAFCRSYLHPKYPSHGGDDSSTPMPSIPHADLPPVPPFPFGGEAVVDCEPRQECANDRLLHVDVADSHNTGDTLMANAPGKQFDVDVTCDEELIQFSRIINSI